MRMLSQSAVHPRDAAERLGAETIDHIHRSGRETIGKQCSYLHWNLASVPATTNASALTGMSWDFH